MRNLTDPGTVKSIMSKYKFAFSKGLGQNFLINPAVCPRMAAHCGAADDTGVLEIGAGIGVLTAELAGVAKKVVALEIDARLIPVLHDTLNAHGNIKIIHADVMKCDLHKLIADEFGSMRVVVCANLPYYITSPVIMKLLEGRAPISSATVMVQKEAAARLCAQPGTRNAGAVSIAVRYYSEPRLLFTVPRVSFMPAPDVDSAVARFDIRSEPPVEVDEKNFFRLVRAAFTQRRKTILNSISALPGVTKQEAALFLAGHGINERARPEQLTLEEFAAISKIMK